MPQDKHYIKIIVHPDGSTTTDRITVTKEDQLNGKLPAISSLISKGYTLVNPILEEFSKQKRYDKFHFPRFMGNAMSEYYRFVESFPEEFPIFSAYKTFREFQDFIYGGQIPKGFLPELHSLFDKFDSMTADVSGPTADGKYNVYGPKQ